MALVTVVATIGVGAATPGATDATAVGTPAAEANATPLGHSIASVMQASAAQAAGTVENGMWAAAYANASNASDRRALVERRYGQLNGTLAELQAERAALQAAFRNGSINRSTYLARLSAVVGRLAALGDGIEAAGQRGAEVGVNATRLETLRSQARNLSGGEVSRLARNLSGGPPPGVFDDPPGRSGERGPGNASNASAAEGGPGQAAGNAGNATRGGDGGQGPPSDPGDQGRDGSSSVNRTATETATSSGN